MKAALETIGATLLWVCVQSLGIEGDAWAAGTTSPSPTSDRNLYSSVASHDEIVARAKVERKLRVGTSVESETLNILKDAFKKKYPFIDVQAEELTGTEVHERLVLELQAGMARDWDALFMRSEFWTRYLPHLKRFDMLRMAKEGALQVPAAMVDPQHRNVLSLGSIVGCLAYNKKLIPPQNIPAKWEDLLKPEFKGRKFTMDVTGLNLVPLVASMGLERTLDYAKKLAAQEPIWVRGYSRSVTGVLSGEYALDAFNQVNSVVRAQGKDQTGSLGMAILEPVPVRLQLVHGILAQAKQPHAALLWLEFLASAAGQKIIDEHEPLKSSTYAPESGLQTLTKEKRLSVIDWQSFEKAAEWIGKIVEAFGFPKAAK